MTNLEKGQGSCLCGEVVVTAASIKNEVGVCHCNMCRRWTGGPLFALDCGSEVSFTGNHSISTYVSSEWAERGFCKNCGSHLFYRLKANGQYIMPAGLFNEENLLFDHQVFIEEKPDYYAFANNTKNMTGAELFALYAPPEE